MRQYYRIAHSFDEGIPSGNIVDMGMPLDEAGEELDPFSFTSGNLVCGITRVELNIELNGPANDFLLAPFDIPILHKRAVDLLTRICPGDFQAIDVNTGFNDTDYAIINVLTMIDCIDPVLSRISYWKEDDGVPSKVGQFSSVDVLVIDPSTVGSHDCFRPIGWEVALLVSDRVKTMFQQLTVKGASFWPV